MRTTKILCLFHALLQELEEISKRSTFHIQRVLILAHFPFTTERKINRIWCLEPLSEEEQSIRKRTFLEEGTKNKGKAMSPELKQELVEFYEKDENSRIFLWKKGKRSMCGKDGEKILDYSPRISFWFFNARLFFTR